MVEAILRGSKAAAEQMLDNNWSGDFPVDPFVIAERLGIRIYHVPMKDPDARGGIVLDPDKPPVIFINQLDKGLRLERFTLAHELGHFYLHYPRPFEFTNVRNPEFYPAEGVKDDPHEIYANSFAANLLMPEGEVKLRYIRFDSVNQMAANFGVPEPCMTNRLKALRDVGILNERKAEYLRGL